MFKRTLRVGIPVDNEIEVVVNLIGFHLKGRFAAMEGHLGHLTKIILVGGFGSSGNNQALHKMYRHFFEA
jgi:hypothetical protein